MGITFADSGDYLCQTEGAETWVYFMNIWDSFASQIEQHYLSKNSRDSYLYVENKHFREPSSRSDS